MSQAGGPRGRRAAAGGAGAADLVRPDDSRLAAAVRLRFGGAAGHPAHEAMEGLDLGAERFERATVPILLRLAQAATGPLDRVALRVQQATDLEEGLDVLPAIPTLLGLRLDGAHQAELGLPVAQHVGLDAEEPRHLADAEVETIRDRDTRHVVPVPVSFIAFLRTWLALKESTRRPEIVISSPVCGLRPFRGRFSWITKLPNPESLIFSPCSSWRLMISNRASTISVASFLENPTRS